jgi:uncharacterized repeat protein (TIGR01451 family)
MMPGFGISTLTDAIQSPVSLVNSGPHLFGIDPVAGTMFRITLAGNTLTQISDKEDLHNAFGLALGPDASLFVSYKARSYAGDRLGLQRKELPPSIEQVSGAGIVESVIASGSPLVEPMGTALAPRYFGNFAGHLIVADASGAIWAIQLKQRRLSMVVPSIHFSRPVDVAFDINDSLLVADAIKGILRVTPSGDVARVIGVSDLGGTPVAMAVHKCTGDLYIAIDSTKQAIVKVDKRTLAVSLFANGFSGLAGGVGIGGLEFSPDGSRLFIGDPGAHKIYRSSGFKRCNRAMTLLKPTMRAAVSGANLLQPGGIIEYSVTLDNDGNTQTDNPGNELEVPIPARTTFVPGSLAATSGYARFNPGSNRIEWNGSLAPMGRAVVTFKALVDQYLVTGTPISAQGYTFYDENGDGTNETHALTDDPGTPVSGDPSELYIVLKGDIDSDGKLTMYDAHLLNRFFRKLVQLTPAQQAAADVAMPCGRLNSRDYARLVVTAQFGRPLQSDCDSVFLRYEIIPDGQPRTDKNTERSLRATALEFAPSANQSAQLTVYDITGRTIFSSGWKNELITWTPAEQTERQVPNGVYLYVLAVRHHETETITRRVGKLAFTR